MGIEGKLPSIQADLLTLKHRTGPVSLKPEDPDDNRLHHLATSEMIQTFIQVVDRLIFDCTYQPPISYRICKIPHRV